MELLENYFKKPSQSRVVNLKAMLLVSGLDCDFNSISQEFPRLKNNYKVNQVRVSDRHFISPQSQQRNYLPDELIISDEYIKSLVKVYYRSDSPLLLRARYKKFEIYLKAHKKVVPLEIKPAPLLKYCKLDYQGHKLSEFVAVLGQDRISIMPFEGCEHWAIGKQCKFCGANPSRLKFREYKHSVYDIQSKYGGDYVKWWAAKEDFILSAIQESTKNLVKLDKLSPHTHLFILSGGLLDVDFLWKICLKIAKVVNKHIKLKKVDSYINLIPPKDFNLLKKAKRLGFKYVCYNLEVFGHQAFKQVCPGKEMVYGYQNFIKAFDKSMKIFGQGKVRCNFVLGAQPIKELLKGVKFLAKQGVVSDYTVFFPRPGSAWSKRHTPTLDDILDFTRELVKIYRQYNFDPFCCIFSSRSSLANEVLAIQK